MWIDDTDYTPSSGGWNRIVTDALTSLANMTPGAGTWAVGTGCIQQTNTASNLWSMCAVTAKVGRPVLAFEVEARFDAGGGPRRFGLGFGTATTGASSAVAYVTGDGASSWTISTEKEGQVLLTSGDAITYTAGNWITLRIEVAGTIMSVFAGGAYVLSVTAAQWAARMDSVFLYTLQCAASFRNLRVWTLGDPS